MADSIGRLQREWMRERRKEETGYSGRWRRSFSAREREEERIVVVVEEEIAFSRVSAARLRCLRVTWLEIGV